MAICPYAMFSISWTELLCTSFLLVCEACYFIKIKNKIITIHSGDDSIHHAGDNNVQCVFKQPQVVSIRSPFDRVTTQEHNLETRLCHLNKDLRDWFTPGIAQERAVPFDVIHMQCGTIWAQFIFNGLNCTKMTACTTLKNTLHLCDLFGMSLINIDNIADHNCSGFWTWWGKRTECGFFVPRYGMNGQDHQIQNK